MRKEKCKAWGAQCESCGKVGHFKTVCRNKGSANTVSAGRDASESGEENTGWVTSLFSSPTKRRHKRTGMKTLSHVALDEFGKWVRSKPESHPVVIVGISISSERYEEFDIPEPARHQPTNF